MLNLLTNKDKDDIAILNAEAILEHKERNYGNAAKLNSSLCQLQQLNSSHWINLAANLKGQRRVFSSHKIIKRGLKLDPTNKELQQALAQSYVEGAAIAGKDYHKKSHRKHRDSEQHNLFQLQFMSSSYHLLPEDTSKNCTWPGKNKEHKKGVISRSKNIKNGNKIKAGYFSSDCNHPVRRFIAGVIKNHNLAEFEIYY